MSFRFYTNVISQASRNFAAGLCAITAVKIFWTLHKLDKTSPDDSEPYRKNVRIHIEHHDVE